MAALDFPTTLRLKEGEWKGGKVGGSERWEKSHVEVPSALQLRARLPTLKIPSPQSGCNNSIAIL
jgi:hypothetical protein